MVHDLVDYFVLYYSRVNKDNYVFFLNNGHVIAVFFRRYVLLLHC